MEPKRPFLDTPIQSLAGIPTLVRTTQRYIDVNENAKQLIVNLVYYVLYNSSTARCGSKLA